MAFDSKIQFLLSDSTYTTFYPSATLALDGSFTVTPTGTETPLKSLPEGWRDIKLMWDREPTYLGIFRKQGQNFQFYGAERATIIWLYFNNGGSEAEIMLTVKKWKSRVVAGVTEFYYEIAYQCFINFVDLANQFFNAPTYGEQKGLLKVDTIDSRIYKLLQSKGANQVNTPLWNYSGSGTGPSSWTTAGKYVWHDSVKLMYSSWWNSSAQPTNQRVLTIQGFARGNTSTGRHTLIAMFPETITQNNGIATWVGNDLMSQYLIQKNEADWPNETTFNTTNDSRPYGRQQFMLYNALTPYGAGTDPLDIGVHVKLQIQPGFGNTCSVSAAPFQLHAVLFEIGSDDLPVLDPITGHYTYIDIGFINIPAGAISGGLSGSVTFVPGTSGTLTAAASALDATVNISLKYDKCYVLGLLIDTNYPVTGLGLDHSSSLTIALESLSINFFSLYNSGTLPFVYAAPMLPPSPVLGFDLATLWSKLVPALDSTQTDPYGFPIIPATPFVGASNLLSTPATYFDADPTKVIVTSKNSLQLIEGWPYVSISVQDFFLAMRSMYGAGLQIVGNTMSIEKLEDIFDAATMIFDLGTNVADLQWMDLSDLKCANVHTGYNTPDIMNTDYAADSFNRTQNYVTPTQAYPGDMSMICPIIADEFAIEKARQQQGQQTPSTDNQTYLLDTTGGNYPFTGGTTNVFDPGRNVHAVPALALQKYYGAQATDPSASTNYYIRGKFYPETALNVRYSPLRNMMRNGGLFASLFDLQAGKNITFQNQYELLFDNSSVPIPGISSNLDIGGAGTPFAQLFNEVSDIPVNSLPPKLFRPFLLIVTTSSGVSHAELYTAMETNPNGYVQFKWGARTYKGFVWSIDQKLADDDPVTFQLLAHPATTDADLMAIG